MKKKIAVCPCNPDHHCFMAKANEVHTWEVNEHGEFLSDLGCDEFSPTARREAPAFRHGEVSRASFLFINTY